MNKKALSMLIAAAAFAAVSLAAESSSADWGARAAEKDRPTTVEAMLRYAIEDEYLARSEYATIMGKFGNQRPFSNIIKAEENHISWLKDAYGRLKLQVPADRSASYVAVPATLNDAFRAGVDAEVDNIAMYESFIATTEISKPENAWIKDLFIRLRDASKNHLAAFKNGLSR